MSNADIFVSVVAFGTGLFCLTAALLNLDWYFKLEKARWIEESYGRTFARCCYAALGAGLVLTGLLIVFDLQPSKFFQSDSRTNTEAAVE